MIRPARSIRHHKAVNFDLRTNELRKAFGEPGRRKAYRQIGAFLSEHGFEHRQGYGYRSTSALTDLEAIDVAIRLHETHEWLFDCTSTFDVTNIGEEYDMDAIVRRHARRLRQHSCI